MTHRSRANRLPPLPSKHLPSVPISTIVAAAASIVGLAAFLYPFALPAIVAARGGADVARGAGAPLILAGVTFLTLIVLVTEFGAPRLDHQVSAAKLAALLAALVALNATLRLLPAFAGASPVFFLIILAGSAFGARFGFLVGTMSLLLSAFLTAGIGPWLPFQMLGAGWVGLAAGWIPRSASLRRRLLYLAAYGAASGLLYGALLNLYSWPFLAPGLDQEGTLFWNPQLGPVETLRRYAAFYLVTSLGHDLFRAVANAVLVLTLGGPVLRALERAHARFSWRSASTRDAGAPIQSTTTESL